LHQLRLDLQRGGSQPFIVPLPSVPAFFGNPDEEFLMVWWLQQVRIVFEMKGNLQGLLQDQGEKPGFLACQMPWKVARAIAPEEGPSPEIGRASCRERV